ncbi:MAG: hypothetical protein Q8J76_08935 [Desulfobulbaceae bacterium]|nr:hypothetical protein [Desulfobulbaceae bacterium]
MFFGYPIAATAENWLHECLVEMVTTIHADLDAGGPARAWPDIILAAYRDALRARTGLRDRLEAYRIAATALTAGQRQQIATGIVQQNRISELCCCVEDCEDLTQMPVSCRAPIENLFDFSFTLLTGLGIRDRHYELIYNGTQYHVCPFCGCEYFDAPGAPREDLDHYLLKSRYPFAAANLRNLVPMGARCNERYKLAQDILRDPGGNRRQVFDPYVDRNIAIRLDNSIPFAGADGKTPSWVIEFDPNSPECSTWDDVFHIRERFQRDVLDRSFSRWLKEFSAWFKKCIAVAAPDAGTVRSAILTYSEDMALLGLNAREFLRAPVFQMLYLRCEGGDDRLNTFMIELVSMNEAN